MIRTKASSDDNWSELFLQMQAEISSFKKPLRTLDKEGQCWKHVREIQLMCSEDNFGDDNLTDAKTGDQNQEEV